MEQEIIKEIQETIVPIDQQKATEEELLSLLKSVAPGTNLRAALDGALKTGKGALIALENERLLPIMDGGFRVNCRFTPQRLIELTKMDGAIILAKDVKKINYANVLLTPDSKIRSIETGTRHKAAERTAKQTGAMVIAISERKNEITLYYKNLRYPLKGTDEIRRKVNEHLQLLEKQRELFDKFIEKLNRLELRNYPSLHQAIQVVQKGRFIQKTAEELKKPFAELGNEGTLMKTRLKEVTAGVDKETSLVIKDYTKLDVKKSKVLLESLSYEELLDGDNVLKSLAYEKAALESYIKGWRILSKSSLTEPEIAILIKEMGSLGGAIHSNIKSCSVLIGEEKAKTFKEEIERIKLNA
ncbi:MAG TPA: DNA integrity scanning diadenylate cyclase DisA [Candidatus Nanoarchaeia archaeon]|nr:DNA integrity scanning diadenylate cyclase DisA [Candidatus Nanoarchaeia archaeon]